MSTLPKNQKTYRPRAAYSLGLKRSNPLKEWKKLDSTIREQFRAKLLERLESPCISSTKLRKSDNRYKIKLKQASYRLVYEVSNKLVTVTVVAIGKRDRNRVYIVASKRNLK